MNTSIIPKEITQNKDSGHNIASFSFYEGRQFVNKYNLKYTTSFSDVFKGTHYTICCGDIMVKVESTDYPEINRKIF